MRRRLLAGLAALALLGSCSTGTPARLIAPGTETRTIEGTVVFPDGTPVPVPKVSSSVGVTVFGDSEGHYTMQVPRDATDITLVASDGYAPDYGYAVRHSGSAAVPDGRSPVTVVVVLVHARPV